jgi:hypothetical protein
LIKKKISFQDFQGRHFSFDEKRKKMMQVISGIENERKYSFFFDRI